VQESAERFQIEIRSDDGATEVGIDATVISDLPRTSIFGTLAEASAFFEAGSLGLSPALTRGDFDGLELRAFGWQVEPLEVRSVHSSLFERSDLFPAGTATFDNALLMRRIEHEWHSQGVMHGALAERRAG
jgi:hypothetical protein